MQKYAFEVATSVYSREYRVFLEQFRETRAQSGLTQRALALELGRSQSYVAKCEQGHNRVDIAQLVEFCRAMDISLLSFIEAYNAALENTKERDDL